MSEYTKGPDSILCAQAIARLCNGSFFNDYDRDLMLLGELRKLYDVHFEGRTTIETAAPDMYEALKAQIVYETCTNSAKIAAWWKFISLRDQALSKADGNK